MQTSTKSDSQNETLSKRSFSKYRDDSMDFNPVSKDLPPFLLSPPRPNASKLGLIWTCQSHLPFNHKSPFYEEKQELFTNFKKRLTYDYQKDIFKQKDALVSGNNSVNSMEMRLSGFDLDPIWKISPGLCFKRQKIEHSVEFPSEVFSLPNFTYTPISAEKMILGDRKSRRFRSCTFEVVNEICSMRRSGKNMSLKMGGNCEIKRTNSWNPSLNRKPKIVFYNTIKGYLDQNHFYRFEIEHAGNWDNSKWALTKR